MTGLCDEQTMRKIHEAEERMNFMFQQKKDLIDQRRKAAVHTKRQKDALLKLLEKAKTCSGEKAVKFLKEGVEKQLR